MRMRILYADRLWLINLLADYLFLLLGAKLCSLPLRRRRYFLAALLGASYSLAMVFPPAKNLLTPGAALLAAVLMGFIAYGGERGALRAGIAFSLLSAGMGGMLWALGLSFGENFFGLKTLLVCFTVFRTVIGLFLRNTARARDREILPVEMEWQGRHFSFRALRDTGNELSDPISGEPVILVSLKTLEGLLGKNAELFSLKEGADILCAVNELGEWRGRFRLIPYKSLGKHGTVLAFRPDRLTVDGEVLRCMVAISPGNLGDGYEALV